MNQKNTSSFIKKWIFLSFFVGIILLSLVPLLKISNLSQSENLGLRTDYLIHFIVFFILILSLKIWKNESFFSKNKSFIPWLIASFLLAIVSESWQIIIPNRTFNPSDLASNLIACVIATSLFFINKKK